MMKPCPYCHYDKHVVKAGLRMTRKGSLQKYYCKACKKSFSNTKQAYTQYPLHVILYALDQYNRGYPIGEVKTRVGKTYKYSPPERTLYSWIKRYSTLFTFTPMRKHYTIDPATILTSHRFYHQQLYLFQYHPLKLNIASKTLPQLRRYITWVEHHLPHTMFTQGPRMSQIQTKAMTIPQQKTNILPKITQYAFSMPHQPRHAHDLIESFMLINDATTVCAELPVFLNPEEINHHLIQPITSPLTGHIDLLQVRNNNLYILDYKPNLNHPERFQDQLLLYKQAVHKRTNIPLNKLVPAVFNRYSYYEFLED